MTEQTSCIVVGAGIAGLMAANRLQDAGWRVTVLDKGRGVGGRMATRRVDDATFDHGAQFFTVRGDGFRRCVTRWEQDGIAAAWSNGFAAHDGTRKHSEHPRYHGIGGMTAIPKALAAGLDVHVSTQVTRVNVEGGVWQVIAKNAATDSERTFSAAHLLMTPPAPQTLALMQSGNVTLPEDITAALQAIAYDPCYTLMVRLDAPSTVPEPGAVTMPGEPLRWIGDNQQKGISDVPAVTIHAGTDFTREHFEAEREQVAALMLDAARGYLGSGNVLSYQLHRWRYSQAVQRHPEPTLISLKPAPVVFAGDAFGGARVEGAAVSGMAAAGALAALI